MSRRRCCCGTTEPPISVTCGGEFSPNIEIDLSDGTFTNGVCLHCDLLASPFIATYLTSDSWRYTNSTDFGTVPSGACGEIDGSPIRLTLNLDTCHHVAVYFFLLNVAFGFLFNGTQYNGITSQYRKDRDAGDSDAMNGDGVILSRLSLNNTPICYPGGVPQYICDAGSLSSVMPTEITIKNV
jgi:hypothetical protein